MNSGDLVAALVAIASVAGSIIYGLFMNKKVVNAEKKVQASRVEIRESESDKRIESSSADQLTDEFNRLYPPGSSD